MTDKPKKIFNERSQFIDNEMIRFEKAIKALQTEILELLLVDYATNFTGDLVMNAENLKHLYELTPIFEQLAELNKGLETKVATDLLKLTEYSKDYFTELGAKVTGIKKEISVLYKAIGITEKGAIISDGYLSKLFGTVNTTFQQTISDYVMESIAGNRSYADFVKGFKGLVKGTSEVDGKLLRYYKTYAYDLYTKVSRMTDNYYAEQLGLTNFIYDGSVIKTTRVFCEDRVGLVFTVDQAEGWSTMDWAGKSEPYSPLMDMGGYNCRHIARWITDDKAAEMLAEQGNEPIK